jgi:hypothetical protein
VSAGEDSASASAAALTDPWRATWTKASIAVKGGSLRIACSSSKCDIVHRTPHYPPENGGKPTIAIAIFAIYTIPFALAQFFCKCE